MPVTTKEIKKTVPVYVADETKRKKAKENCVTIESNLKSEFNKLTTTKADYKNAAL